MVSHQSICYLWSTVALALNVDNVRAMNYRHQHPTRAGIETKQTTNMESVYIKIVLIFQNKFKDHKNTEIIHFSTI